MKSDYSIIKQQPSFNTVIGRLHKEELLCVIIQDKGTLDDLLSCISWFKENMNFSIHVCMNNDRTKLETLQKAHPDITYLVFNRPVSLANRINAMATECYTTYFLVVRSDMNLTRFDGGVLIDYLLENTQTSVICPIIKNQEDETVPSLRIPLYERKREFKIESQLPDSDVSSTRFYNTLYPFWGVGLYKRAIFQRLRGMDEQITSSYWQTLDFGTRSWLFGYTVIISNALQVKFKNKINLQEDISECEKSERCYAKVFGVSQIDGKNYTKRWLGHNALIRAEVKPKLSLYKMDYKMLCTDFVNREQ